MKLHSDKISHNRMRQAIATGELTRGLPGVEVHWTPVGSRSHAVGHEITLRGNGKRANSGAYGAGYENGATWDEWGVVIARIYELDHSALWGTVKYPVYTSRLDFHDITRDRFAGLELPEDTHKSHRWDWSSAVRLVTGALIVQCKGTKARPCGAQMKRG